MKILRNHGKNGKCAMASWPTLVFKNPAAPPSASAAVELPQAEAQQQQQQQRVVVS